LFIKHQIEHSEFLFRLAVQETLFYFFPFLKAVITITYGYYLWNFQKQFCQISKQGS